MKVFVLNCGSSSVKYQLFDMPGETILAKGKIERIGMDTAVLTHQPAGKESVKQISPVLVHTAAIRKILDILIDPAHGVIRRVNEIGAVGHRIVHGGEYFTESVIVTDEVKSLLKECIELAPLHTPAHLMGITGAQSLMPDIPHVLVFDTAFHATMPRHVFLYGIPYVLYKRHKVRRYGFHGTSHEYVSRRAANLLGMPIQNLKMITCHLGNGASVTAIKNGKSYDTSMGFTPLEGLVMGTRSGDIDPAAVFYIMGREELSVAEANAMLNKHSGLIGISGVSSDMREIEEEMERGNEKAREAFDIYEYRARKYIGAYAAAMDGVDAIVFTAGVGENSYLLREKVCSNLTYLGVELDEEKNRNKEPEKLISRETSRVKVLVIPTNEELVIARHTYELVEEKRSQG